MPELPDLQVFSTNLDKTLKNKTVKKVTVHNSKKLNVSVKELKAALEEQSFKQVYREGKELRFAFKNNAVLGVHLMLHGKLEIFKNTEEPRHTIAALFLDDNTGLAVTDFQGMAALTLNPAKSDVPDALSKEMDADYLTKQLAKKKSAVKNILLDQHIIRGIGNAYADEILWEARISPFSAANKIPESKVKDLEKAIKKVLTQAEKEIVKKHPDIIGGEVRDFMKVHNAKQKHSPTGAEINVSKAGSRKTYYTEEQELFE